MLAVPVFMAMRMFVLAPVRVCSFMLVPMAVVALVCGLVLGLAPMFGMVMAVMALGIVVGVFVRHDADLLLHPCVRAAAAAADIRGSGLGLNDQAVRRTRGPAHKRSWPLFAAR